MKYKLIIDNPNGSYSQILVQRILFPTPMWNWEELGAVKYLEDNSIDRVEGEILDALGDPDDFSAETAAERLKYWADKEEIEAKTERILSQYF